MMKNQTSSEQSLEQAILERLAAPVKTKTGAVLLDEDGEPLSVTEAIAMSITQKAMHGDLAAASFIRNLTKTPGQSDEKCMSRYLARKAQTAEKIKKQLKDEGLWTGQEIEIERIASLLILVEDLEGQMHQPGYEDVVTEYSRSGAATLKANPIHDMVDHYVDQIDKRMEKVRTDARMRIQRDKLLTRK